MRTWCLVRHGVIVIATIGLGLGCTSGFDPAPAQTAANEASAVAHMKTIVVAETAYHAANGRFGTLEELAGANPPFIAGAIATGTVNGYAFAEAVMPSETEFAYTAAPVEPGETGVRRFYVDQTGIVRSTADGTTPTADSPPA